MTIIFDVDGVIYNTKESVFNHLKSNYGAPSHIKTYKDVKRWDYNDMYPYMTPEVTQSIVAKAYQNKEIYSLDNIDQSMVQLIQELRRDNSVIICSIGDVMNSMNKIMYIEQALPGVKQIPIITDDPKYDTKKYIDMEDCIFIDDTPRILNDSNAKVKIQYTKFAQYDSSFDKCKNIEELREKLMKYINLR